MQGNTAAAHKDSPSFATRVWVPPGTPLTGKVNTEHLLHWYISKLISEELFP